MPPSVQHHQLEIVLFTARRLWIVGRIGRRALLRMLSTLRFGVRSRFNIARSDAQNLLQQYLPTGDIPAGFGGTSRPSNLGSAVTPRSE
jgi:hypothetical protein